MADFSLTTLFVVPVGQATYPSTGSTQDLTAGQVGFFNQAYVALTSGTIAAADYFYVAQGRTNTYLHGSKRSDKIKGCPTANCKSNITEWYKVTGCPTPIVQITDIDDWHVKCGDIVTLTIRAHSSYLDTLYFNGLTRSVTVVAPCCACDGDPCADVDVSTLIDSFIEKLEAVAPNFLLPDGYTGSNPDNIHLTQFFTFTNVGGTILRITGLPLTTYGQPCDVAAFPFEYDRMWFRTFVYSGPATTADFIVSDACNIVADSTIVQNSNYAKGTADEIKQLEKNYYSYQVGALKHLHRIAGYNAMFESWVTDGTTYDTYYIKFNEYDKSAYQWGDYITEDSMVIIAVAKGSAEASALSTILTAALGAPVDGSGACVTTTSTTTVAPTTTTTTTAQI
jgi:hypothetical protein